jgi:hypothetical protein
MVSTLAIGHRITQQSLESCCLDHVIPPLFRSSGRGGRSHRFRQL